jgi:hypothetical protein
MSSNRSALNIVNYNSVTLKNYHGLGFFYSQTCLWLKTI